MRNLYRWHFDENRQTMIDGVIARDLLVQCFFAAHGDNIAIVKQHLDFPSNESAVRKSIADIVRWSFESAGANFNNPTRLDLIRAMEELKTYAKIFHAPPQMMYYHEYQMQKVLRLL
ncbi:MAG: hypothetical protein M0042_07075 [Nitrospiraceae bacterium]|nr:hypothetical protein [Nitrospiraceae bacterium]